MTRQEAEDWYRQNLTDPICQDVAEHLNLLRRYASCCDDVVELGTYDGTTALAFLLGLPEHLRCIDIARRPEVDRLVEAAEALGVGFTFEQADSRTVSPSLCEMLFIDTCHNAETLRSELVHWSRFVMRYILLHDTEEHGDIGMEGGAGLWEAIGFFLLTQPEWRLSWHRENPSGKGLTCLVRVQERSQ